MFWFSPPAKKRKAGNLFGFPASHVILSAAKDPLFKSS